MTAVSCAHRVGVVVVRRAPGTTTSSSIGLAELHQGRGPQRHLVGEREADRHDAPGRRRPPARAPSAMRAAPVLIGSMRGRSCVVPSGKMATTSPLDEGPVALVEGVLVADRAARVDLPVHEHHPDAPEQPARRAGTFCSVGLGDEAGRAAQRGR